jgi:ribosomal protein S18 acetylase RimI-like enzyme
MSIDIRPAADGDLAAMRDLGAAALLADRAEGAALVGLLAGRPGQLPELRLVAASAGGAGYREGIVGLAIGSVRERIGYLDAIAVGAPHRRRGIGRELLGELETQLASAGARSLRIGANSWYYAWPGVDLAYTEALRLAEAAGYRRRGTIQNMSLSLREWVSGSSAVVLRDSVATRVRRAVPEDAVPLDTFVSRHFSPAWRREVLLALDRPVPTAFVAIRDRRLVGFGCHGVYRRDWFGPLGTDPAQRSGGIGEALLRRCLDDLAAAGIEQAEISWIGPAGFYTRSVGARCDREFAFFDKDLDARITDDEP